MIPYKVDVPQSKLDLIRSRVAGATIGYAPDDDGDWRYGMDAAYLSELRDYWRDRYDWREAEEAFNAHPQFHTEIEGITIHFYHVRAAQCGAFPIILTHGWPGSVLEFLEVIPRLRASGYDVVVPSLPGYGFSGRPLRPIGPTAVARMWRALMVEVLGYRRFGAQGGDWGAMVTHALGRDHPDVVAAIHLNMLFHTPRAQPDVETQAWLAQFSELMQREGAYWMLQQTKPQTIGLALADSPLGFAAWVIEKCRSWSDCGGEVERRFSRHALITNVMTYLVNDNVQAGIWMYYGMAREPSAGAKVTVPTGFAEFPAEFVPPPPRQAVEQDYNLVHWSKMPAGGHFAAWEEPRAFAEEVAGFFDRWR